MSTATLAPSASTRAVPSPLSRCCRRPARPVRRIPELRARPGGFHRNHGPAHVRPIPDLGPRAGHHALVGFVGFVVALISSAALRNFGPVLFYAYLAIFGAVGLVIAGAIMGAVICRPRVQGVRHATTPTPTSRVVSTTAGRSASGTSMSPRPSSWPSSSATCRPARPRSRSAWRPASPSRAGSRG